MPNSKKGIWAPPTIKTVAVRDFDHPDEIVKRAICATEGHLSVAELEHTQATHGTKHVCRRCGKYWHGEPLPPVVLIGENT